jgi:MFS family permease
MTEATGRFTAYWERRLDKLDEKERRRARRLPGWRDRRHRRPLAAVLVVADLVLVAGAATFTVGSPWVFSVLWLGGILAGGTAFVLLRTLTGLMCGGFSRLLDEREREWRHRVTYTGYQILSYLMIFALCYCLLIAHTENGGSRGAMMLSALLVTGATVPSVLLGWALPDDDPEDFAEGMGHA